MVTLLRSDWLVSSGFWFVFPLGSNFIFRHYLMKYILHRIAILSLHGHGHCTWFTKYSAVQPFSSFVTLDVPLIARVVFQCSWTQTWINSRISPLTIGFKSKIAFFFFFNCREAALQGFRVTAGMYFWCSKLCPLAIPVISSCSGDELCFQGIKYPRNIVMLSIWKGLLFKYIE